MSRFLPVELRHNILSFIPLSQLLKYKLSNNILINLLHFTYQIDPIEAADVINNPSLLPAQVIFFKIATQAGDIAPGAEMFERSTFSLIKAIMANDFNSLRYFLIHGDLGDHLDQINLLVSLALKAADSRIYPLVMAYYFSGPTPSVITSVAKITNTLMYHDKDYPVYSFETLSNDIVTMLEHLDFPGLKQHLSSNTIYQFPTNRLYLKPTLLPAQLFIDLPLFRNFIAARFADSATYLLYLDILADKPIDLTAPRLITVNNNIVNLASSVLHHQIMQMIGPDSEPELFPSEKLYHLELLDELYATNIHMRSMAMSVLLCKKGLIAYGIHEEDSYIEQQYYHRPAPTVISLHNAASVRVMSQLISMGEEIVMWPNTLAEYEEMKLLVTAKINFDPVYIDDFIIHKMVRDKKRQIKAERILTKLGI